jgi:hypothetical protein
MKDYITIVIRSCLLGLLLTVLSLGIETVRNIPFDARGFERMDFGRPMAFILQNQREVCNTGIYIGILDNSIEPMGFSIQAPWECPTQVLAGPLLVDVCFYSLIVFILGRAYRRWISGPDRMRREWHEWQN